MQDPADPNASLSSEASWTDYVDTVLRSWRLVVYGCLAAWLAILAAALLVPRRHTGSAAVSLPNLIVPKLDKDKIEDERKNRPVPLLTYERLEGGEPGKRTGVPIAFYKEMERTLADEAVLRAGLQQHLSARQIARMLDRFDDHFKTLTTNPRDELERIQPNDGVTGVVVEYKGHPPDRVRAAVQSMVDLVRDSFVTTLVRHEVQQRMLDASRHSAQARADHLNLAHANESLEREAADLARLLKEAPAERGPQPQVMVNTEGRGHLYVSPAAQLVGVKAAIAENAHLIRTFQREAAVNDLSVAFLRRVDGRFQDAVRAGGSPTQVNAGQVLTQEAEAFLKDRTGPEADFIRAQAEGFREILASATAAVRVVQTPTLQREPRALLVGLAMVGALLVFLSAAVLAESWRRWHRQGPRALNDAA